MSDIIQVICGELTTSFENEVVKAVQQVGINVNKEELLKALELADKLVRCEDCKYWDNRFGLTDTEGSCEYRGGKYNFTDPDYYCASGERKEE